MKKALLSLLLLTSAGLLWATKPQEWAILRSDYAYSNGRRNTDFTYQTDKIKDIAVTADNKLWILTNEKLYCINNPSSTFRPEQPLPTKGIPLENCKLYANAKGGLYLLSPDMLWTSTDYKEWISEPIAPEPEIAKAGPHLTKVNEMFPLPDGNFYLSGTMDGIPIIMRTDPDEGPSFTFLSPEEAKKARQTTPFFFTDIHQGKQAQWMRGGKNPNNIWKLSWNKFTLLSDNVYSIASDAEGNVYASSNEAIYKINEQKNISDELLDIGARYIVCDKTGKIWIVPLQSSPSCLLKAYTPPAEDSTAVEAKEYTLTEAAKMLINPKALLKANAEQSRTKVRSAGNSFTFTAENSPLAGTIKKILIGNDNTKYILTENPIGIYCINDSPASLKDWTILNKITTDEATVAENTWSTLGKDMQNNDIALIEGKNDLRTLTFQNKEWIVGETITKPKYFDIHSRIVSMLKYNDILYIATYPKFYYVTNNSCVEVEGLDKKQFSNSSISAMLIDKQNNMWLGSDKGIAKFDGTNYTYFNKKNTPELQDASISSISEDSNGNLLFGTDGGLALFADGKWSFFDKKSGLDSKKVRMIASNSKGQTFALGTGFIPSTDVLSIYENGQIRNETLPRKIYIEKVIVDSYDNLWIQESNALFCRKANGEYVTYDASNSPIPGKPYFIKNMFLVNNEIHLITDEPAKDPFPAQHASGTLPVTLPTNLQLSTYTQPKQVLIYTIQPQ